MLKQFGLNFNLGITKMHIYHAYISSCIYIIAFFKKYVTIDNRYDYLYIHILIFKLT